MNPQIEPQDDRAVCGKRGSLVEAVTSLAERLQNTNYLNNPRETRHPWDDFVTSAYADMAINAAIDAERRIEYLEKLAHTDELTGLLNRRGFETELKRTLSAARRYDERGILVYVDLDGFKPVNDAYGHAAGDEVLRGTARVLLENVRASDVVGRLGGDEFAVLIARTDWDHAILRARLIKEMLNQSVVGWEGRMIAIHASFGIQTFDGESNSQSLFAGADKAMYRSKQQRSGANRFAAKG